VSKGGYCVACQRILGFGSGMGLGLVVGSFVRFESGYKAREHFLDWFVLFCQAPEFRRESLSTRNCEFFFLFFFSRSPFFLP